MQIDLEKTQGNVIRSYAPGELRINDLVFHESVILTTTEIHTAWAPNDITKLCIADFEFALAQNPEVILFGTGETQYFPPPALIADVMNRGIGFEFMDTGAACRTYNVLASEQRRVVAALMLG